MLKMVTSLPPASARSRQSLRSGDAEEEARMIDEQGIFLGASPSPSGPVAQHLVLRRANRHGLIAGATGTGKTVTLQGIAENFSSVGVPVFLADVKGDLAGISMAGSATAKNADKLV